MYNIDKIVETFSFFDSWEDKYKYIIELGEELPILEKKYKNEDYRVLGCISQVWIKINKKKLLDVKILTFKGDSDSHIVKGLMYIVFSIFDCKSAIDILNININNIFIKLNLNMHLTIQRSNGLQEIIRYIKEYAKCISNNN